MNKKILLVEDEINVVDFLKKGLDEANFEVSVALNGNTALSMAAESSFDLIILDIMLPDKNGIEVCRELRSRHIKTPILFLTALGTSENIALGLNSGADDYLVKPFKFIELYARINALLRRTSYIDNIPDDKARVTYTIGDLIIDDDAKTVSRGDQKISLTATEYRLLLVLIKNKGKVLSRIDILESAWDINFNMGTNVVDVYINYLRKKIDGDFEHKLIHTVVGMGYVLKEK
ncbi:MULTISPECIES: response regulator transcription factor [unclassified Arcicella]|uniref:response regulator transcription factor n=1 Tax=unclassified Arcicella TaxID=2644986 RepID=UPI00285D9C56|nr:MULTISPECIES: response regulator transcription factor [unclassified Arcicella]MDR6563029.1 DNA-binding response OmpR family regulator [Arcicella sp. BE51]MDR6813113.1 DNA-binding response OmpR family regulator [Arcicella sp. BE140]MDR6824427.1 DNA-binding response OmpR family regulator [Arcicella sp. BE139]